MVQPCHGRVVVLLVKVDVLGHVTDGVNHPLALVKFHSFLTVVGKFHGFADLKITAVGLDNVEQQLDECGLTHTVITHDAQLLVAGKRVVEIVENHLVAITLADVVGCENLLADVSTLDVQFNLTVVAPLLGSFLQVIESVDAVLCLVGTGLGLASHPVQLGAQQVAGPFHLGILCLNAFGSFLQVVIIVAVVGEDAVLVHLEDAVADVVQEIAVMGHHQQGHTATLQVVLQPLDHVDVEVVGRLVENEHLGVVDEQSCQGNALHLTTAQLLDWLIIVSYLELCENLLKALLIVPCGIGVHCLDSGCHGVTVTCAQGLLIGMDGFGAGIVTMQTGIKHSQRTAQVGQLGQVTHAQVIAVDDRSAVGRGDAGKDVE